LLIDPTPMSRKAPLPHNWKPRHSMSRYPVYLSILNSIKPGTALILVDAKDNNKKIVEVKIVEKIICK